PDQALRQLGVAGFRTAPTRKVQCRRGRPIDKAFIVARMLRSRCRRVAGVYLTVFFLAVAGAPHRHINDLEDLPLDQRSDSGVLVQTLGTTARDAAPALHPARVVHDVSCLACFTRDFVSAPTESIHFVPTLEPLLLLPDSPSAATPALLATET